MDLYIASPQTQISKTIPQTDIISTNKQLINAVSQSSYKCAEISEINFFHGHTCIQQSFFLHKHVIQINRSKLRLKEGREIQDFYVLRQGVPVGRSGEGYASFKQIKSWLCHVEVIPGVSVVGLVTINEELCKVVWGIIIKNFMHKYSFIVSELLR